MRGGRGGKVGERRERRREGWEKGEVWGWVGGRRRGVWERGGGQIEGGRKGREGVDQGQVKSKQISAHGNEERNSSLLILCAGCVSRNLS